MDIRTNPIFAVPQHWKDLKKQNAIELLEDDDNSGPQITPNPLMGGSSIIVGQDAKQQLRKSQTKEELEKNSSKERRRTQNRES